MSACYIGARASVIEQASFVREEGRPWADLENGVFHPRPVEEPPRQGSFYADPIPIPGRLLMHMKRWRNGKPGSRARGTLSSAGGGRPAAAKVFGR